MKAQSIYPLVAAAALALGGQTVHAAAADEEKNEADIEARLEAARERLEAAAREVAELSGELTGPVMHDFMVGRRMGRRAMLGVNVGAEESKDGVPLDSVTPGGPASTAGLKAGDVLVSIDGKRLGGTDSPARTLVRHLRDVKPGTKVQVEYLRDGKKQKAEVVTEALDMKRFVHAMPGNRVFMSDAPHAAVAPVPGVPPLLGLHGFPGHGLLDMELITLTPKLGSYFGTERGVLVVRAPSKSELKLEEGDVIVDIDGRAPQSGAHAMRILRSYQPGEKLQLNVLRNRKTVKLEVTVPQRPEGWGESFGMFEIPLFDAGPMVEPVPPAAAEEAT